MKIPRYAFFVGTTGIQPGEREWGEWCKWRDAEAEYKRLRKRIRELEKVKK